MIDNKTSILVTFDGESTKATTFDDPSKGQAAYELARENESLHFVGFLRKPTWYKRCQPSVNAQNLEVAKMQAEKRDKIKAAADARTELEKAEALLAAAKLLADDAATKSALAALAERQEVSASAAVDAEAALEIHPPVESEVSEDEVSEDEVSEDPAARDAEVLAAAAQAAEEEAKRIEAEDRKETASKAKAKAKAARAK